MPSRNGANPELLFGGHSTQLPLPLAAAEPAAPAAAVPAPTCPRPPLPRPPPETLPPLVVAMLPFTPVGEFVWVPFVPVAVAPDVLGDGSAKAPPFAG